MKSIHTRNLRNLSKFRQKASYLDSGSITLCRRDLWTRAQSSSSTFKSMLIDRSRSISWPKPRAPVWPQKPLDGHSSHLPQIPVFRITPEDIISFLNMHLQMHGPWSDYKLITSIEHLYRDSIVSFKHRKQKLKSVQVKNFIKRSERS